MKRFADAAIAATIGLARALLVVALCALPSVASQNGLSSPTTGTVTGLALTNSYNSALDSLNTCNSGASAPTNQLSGSPSLGNCWINTSTSPITMNIYDGTQWVTIGYLDASQHIWVGITGAGNPPGVASASTTNLCPSPVSAAVSTVVTLTGSAGISSFGSNCQIGQLKVTFFAGAMTLMQSASMSLPTGANIATASGDFAIWFYDGAGTWYCINYMRASGAALSTVGLNVGAAALAQTATGYDAPINMGIGASIGSNQLTVSISGATGSLSSTNPSLINFRSQTPTLTVPIFGSIQAPQTFTLASTSSMGCTTGVVCRLWVTEICQTESGGACTSMLPGLSVQSNANACFPLMEGNLQSTGSGTSGGTTAGLIQTSVSALSGKAIRIVGYIEATWTSGAGWATTPSLVQLFGSGVKKPCDVVQDYFAPLTSLLSGSVTSYSPSLTAPTAANGLSIVSQPVTPQSAADLFLIEGSAYIDANSAGNQTTAYLYDGTNVLTAGYAINAGSASATATGIARFKYKTVAGSTSPKTFSLYGIANFNGTIYINGTNDNAIRSSG